MAKSKTPVVEQVVSEPKAIEFDCLTYDIADGQFQCKSNVAEFFTPSPEQLAEYASKGFFMLYEENTIFKIYVERLNVEKIDQAVAVAYDRFLQG